MVSKRLVLVCLLAFAAPLLAADAEVKGFRSEFLQQLDDLENKLVGLAEATPADKFTWRPAAGVRSISEVYMHVAAGNFMIPRTIGVQPPEGIQPREMQKFSEKAKVVDTLKQSIQHVRQAAMSKADGDLDKPAKIFGQDSTVRGAMFLLASHMHEHLGQSIAYARMNGIAPPWSRTEQ